jgi:hypothetical protein
VFARKNLGAGVGLFLVAVGGCFNQPNIDAGSLKCATAENCPVGYFCVGVSGVPPRGICMRQASSDGGADAPAVADAEVGIGRNDSLPVGGNTSVDVDGLDGARDTSWDTSLAPEVSPDRFSETQEDGNADTANALSDSQLPEHPLPAPEAGTDVPIAGAGGAGGSGGAGGATVVGGLGGVSGSGGVTAAGGATGNGGFIGAGGTVSMGGVGGVATSGGVIGAGGVTSTGGISVTGGATGTGGSSSTGGSPGTGGTVTIKGPCDIYKEIDGQSCVAAHSTIRRLSGTYAGPLYQVRAGGSNTGTGGTTTDIGALADGFADAVTQDAACGASACTISIIYDQSGQGNHLTHTLAGGSAKPGADNEADANALKLTVAGHTVYGVHIHSDPYGVGYRNNMAVGTATGDNAETEYAVLSGDYFNGGCCFDYGNMETNSHDNSEGAMEAIYFGNCSFWGKGAGTGPWVMGDLENGLWAGNTSPFAGNPSIPGTWKYLAALLKGDAAGKNHWTIKEGNAQSGGLTTPFDGPRPSARYSSMKKEGAIGLGTSGDNSNGGNGNFFEGVMTAHYSSDAADDAVQANIVAVYGL